MTTRKKYSKEFKLDAISLVLDQGYTQTEAARSLAIDATMLVAGSRNIKAREAKLSGETAS